MDGNIDIKSDISAEDHEKRGELDKIWPKMSPNTGLNSSKTIGFLIGIFRIMLE
jgi:hypothetical protein